MIVVSHRRRPHASSHLMSTHLYIQFNAEKESERWILNKVTFFKFHIFLPGVNLNFPIRSSISVLPEDLVQLCCLDVSL